MKAFLLLPDIDITLKSITRVKLVSTPLSRLLADKLQKEDHEEIITNYRGRDHLATGFLALGSDGRTFPLLANDA